MVVSQGAFAAMVFTDRLFMSYIDAPHIAAALGGGVASFVCFSLFHGGDLLRQRTWSPSTTAPVTWHKCPRVTTQGVLIALGSAPVLFVLAYYGVEVFELMGHDPAQVPLEQLYFQVLMAGQPVPTLIKASLASYFSGIGRTRVVMVADLLGATLNIPLSWMLIFGKFGLPELGIAGAGLGTIVATLFSIGVFLAFYLSKDHEQQFKVAGFPAL